MMTPMEMLARREALLGPHLPTFYDEPVHFVRAKGVWMWDSDGRKYLDCYNNVPHVGHCNRRVVEAITRQASLLNTHTRYLHDGILDYAERLTATFAPSLSTVVMTCTGSEANDIALRMAQSVTGKRGVIATDCTYHGNTTAVSALSFDKAPKMSDRSHIRYVPAPDSYRLPDREAGASHAKIFASKVEKQIADLQQSEHGFSALIICPYFVNEGFPDLPPGWLDPTIAAVRKAGGLVIADEVQPGFGRIGTHMWGHQYQGFTPDIVTLGKPMANGHPVGAVVTEPQIMASFRQAFRYFNTFGGNPVSCAAAMAVLDELEDRQLMTQAKRVGGYAQEKLALLAAKHACIGDTRGSGMIIGAEMVLDRSTKEPASQFTDRVVNEMCRRGIVLSKLGRHKNTLKIRPPMPFAEEHVDLLIGTLDDVLTAIRPDDS